MDFRVEAMSKVKRKPPRPPIQLTCDACGKTFMRAPSKYKAKYADAEDWHKVPREKWLDALLRHVLHIWDNPWLWTTRAAYRLCGML